MKEKNWDNFSIEPRPELWSRLEDRLEVNSNLKLVKLNLRRQLVFAAASILLVFGMSFAWLFQSSQPEDVLTEIIFTDKMSTKNFVTGKDIYSEHGKIEEGSAKSRLVVKGKSI